MGVYAEVEPNPGTTSVERGSAALAAFGTHGTIVVPVGGGSSMDTAKAVSLHVRNEGDVLALGYHDPRILHGLPLVAVPTTAGTGAETNTYGVITDEAAGRKAYVGHPSVLPVASVLDPELTVGPATGADRRDRRRRADPFARVPPVAQPESVRGGDRSPRDPDEWRRGCPVAVDAGANLEARSQLLVAAHLAGLGQASGTGVGAVHAIGHALGTRGKSAPRHGPGHGPAGGPRVLHRRPGARAGAHRRCVVGGDSRRPASARRRGRRSPASTRCSIGSASAGRWRNSESVRNSRPRSSPTPSRTPRSRTARGCRQP